jgi:carboxypeptidase C (cathepsin A)
MSGNAQGGRPKINLQAIAIGNGLVQPEVQYMHYHSFASALQLLPQESLDWMEAGKQPCFDAILACQATLNETGSSDLLACAQATAICNLGELIPYVFSGKNVYDVTKKVRGTNKERRGRDRHRACIWPRQLPSHFSILSFFVSLLFSSATYPPSVMTFLTWSVSWPFPRRAKL